MCSGRWDWCSALKLLLLPVLATGIPDQSGTKAITLLSGSNVTLQGSRELLDNYTQGTWFYNTSQKIVEWDLSSSSSSGSINYFNTGLKQRVSFDPQSAALHMYNAQKEDSSTYILRESTDDGAEREIKIMLEVFDPVPEAVIEIEMAKKEGEDCRVTLSCKIPDGPVNSTWYGDSGPFPKEFHRSAERRSVLDVTLTPQNQSRLYTCQISNPVSSQNDTVYFLPPCTLVRSSGVTPIVTWLMVLVPIIPVLLLT